MFSSDFESHTHNYWDSNRLIVDTHGNLYGIASENYDTASYSENRTIKRTLFKYTSTGVEQWRVEDTYTIEAGSHSYGYNRLEAFVDSSGNFYTSRQRELWSFNSDTGNHESVKETNINKYSSSTGVKLWSKDFESHNTYYHQSGNVVFEHTDGLYMRTQEDVFDNVSSSTTTEYKIVKYNNDGVEQWSKSTNYGDMSSITVDRDNVYFINSNTELVKYSHSGVEQRKIILAHNYHIEAVQDGNIYLSYHTGPQFSDGSGSKLIIAKYTTAGSVLWSKETGVDTSSWIQIDRNRNVYHSQEGRKYYDNGTLKSIQPTLTKYKSSNGVEQWKLAGMDVTVDASAYDHIHSWSHPVIVMPVEMF